MGISVVSSVRQPADCRAAARQGRWTTTGLRRSGGRTESGHSNSAHRRPAGGPLPRPQAPHSGIGCSGQSATVVIRATTRLCEHSHPWPPPPPTHTHRLCLLSCGDWGVQSPQSPLVGISSMQVVHRQLLWLCCARDLAMIFETRRPCDCGWIRALFNAPPRKEPQWVRRNTFSPF